MGKLSLQDMNLHEKKVLMRVDFNVPLDANGQITDDTRIRSATHSIEYILKQNASIVLMSHLGRPKGKKDPKYSLAPVAKRLSELLGKDVRFAPDCIGEEVQKMATSLEPGEVLLLENLRFHDAEEHPEKDPAFAEKLASLGEVFVNDAFGTAHRKHSSTHTIASFFPHKTIAGFLMDKEIAFLGSVVQNPKRPFFAIIGGAKVSTKTGVLTHLVEKIDGLFIGGGMAFTFFKAQGISIGKSIIEESEVETAKKIMEKCQERAIKLWLPVDIVIADHFQNDANTTTINIKDGIKPGWIGVDIGKKTIQEWAASFANAATIFWNGPLGVFEMPNFAKGTNEIAIALASTRATTVVGGGDSVAAIQQLGIADRFTHLSTGGGASLEYIEYGHLPGIDVLSDR